MCFGELGVVEERRDDVAVVRTDRGLVEVTLLLTPDASVGDHLVLHSGHALEVVERSRARDAAQLRQAMQATPRAGPGP